MDFKQNMNGVNRILIEQTKSARLSKYSTIKYYSKSVKVKYLYNQTENKSMY